VNEQGDKGNDLLSKCFEIYYLPPACCTNSRRNELQLAKILENPKTSSTYRGLDILLKKIPG